MTHIGHNNPPRHPSAANRETAYYMLGREYLVTAIQDRRLERAHLRVLACIVLLADKETFQVWPRRLRSDIAEKTGYATKTVSNIVIELRQFGYIIPDVLPDDEKPQGAIPYTFGNIDHETIRREITIAARRIRDAERVQHGDEVPRPRGTKFPASGEQTSPPTGNFRNFPARGELELPRPRGTNFPAHGEQTSPPTGNIKASPSKIKDLDDRTSPPAGNFDEKPAYNTKSLSVSEESLSSSTDSDSVVGAKSKRDIGTRLPDDWVLTRSQGEWALANFQVSAEQVREEAAAFKDFWTSKSGADARKRDWPATWRNWCRRAKGWRRRQGAPAVDELLLSAQDELAAYNAMWDEARAMNGGDDDRR